MIVGGILGPFEDVLASVLKLLHGSVGLPWAWAIVGLTVIVRMLLVPLTVRQIRSMQNLQRYAPQMKEIQRKYKQDKVRQREELMRFYKENEINPAASCLPMVAQFPIFIALFFVLRDFDDEILPDYPGSDLGWLGLVPDITENAGTHWSGYVLLVVYATSQTLSTLFMSTTMDKTQRALLLMLPLAFLFFVVNFPAGLVIYWMTTNLWTVGQGLITRRLVPRTPAPTLRRSSRTPPREATAASDGAKPAEGAEEPAKAAEPKAAGPPRRVKRKKKRAKR